MSAVTEPPAAAGAALNPAAEAVRRSLLALPAGDRAAVLAAVARSDRGLPGGDPAGDRPLGAALARTREAVLRWEREAAAGRPYTPARVGGCDVVPDGPPGAETSAAGREAEARGNPA